MAKDDQKQVSISINLDSTPILYTDNINIVTNKHGVVLNVMQNVGAANDMRIVARIGMSREHAKEFVDQMGKLLLLTESNLKEGRTKNTN